VSLCLAKYTLTPKGWGGLEWFVNEHKYYKLVPVRKPAAACASILGKQAVQAVLGHCLQQVYSVTCISIFYLSLFQFPALKQVK